MWLLSLPMNRADVARHRRSRCRLHSRKMKSTRRVQRSVAAQLALPQQLLPLETLVGPKGVIRESLDLCSSFPAPSTNLWRPAYARLGSMAVAEDRRVLLTGGGGDEWLGVTPMYAANYDAGRYRRAGTVCWPLIIDRFHSRCSALLRNVLWRFGLRPLMGDYAAKGNAGCT